MKLRIWLVCVGALIVLVSGVAIYAVFYLSHGTLTGPGPDHTGEPITFTADRYAGFIAARVLSVLLPVLGAGIVLAGLAGSRWPRGSAAFPVVAGLLATSSGLVIAIYGFPTQFHAVLPGSQMSGRLFINVRLDLGYYLFSVAVVPFGIVAAILGIVQAVGLRRASRPAPAVE